MARGSAGRSITGYGSADRRGAGCPGAAQHGDCPVLSCTVPRGGAAQGCAAQRDSQKLIRKEKGTILWLLTCRLLFRPGVSVLFQSSAAQTGVVRGFPGRHNTGLHRTVSHCPITSRGGARVRRAKGFTGVDLLGQDYLVHSVVM